MEKDREGFEKWARDHGVTDFSMTDCNNPIYFNPDLQGCWLTWQARQPEIDALNEKIESREAQMETVGIIERELRNELARLQAENERLKAEVEQLHNKLVDAILTRQARDAELLKLKEAK